MKIQILGSASRDLIEGFRFYESQVEGVGAYFLDSLFSDIDSLIISAGVHAVHFGKYHRLLSKRFPFAVYYRIEDENPDATDGDRRLQGQTETLQINSMRTMP